MKKWRSENEDDESSESESESVEEEGDHLKSSEDGADEGVPDVVVGNDEAESESTNEFLEFDFGDEYQVAVSDLIEKIKQALEGLQGTGLVIVSFVCHAVWSHKRPLYRGAMSALSLRTTGKKSDYWSSTRLVDVLESRWAEIAGHVGSSRILFVFSQCDGAVFQKHFDLALKEGSNWRSCLGSVGLSHTQTAGLFLNEVLNEAYGTVARYGDENSRQDDATRNSARNLYSLIGALKKRKNCVHQHLIWFLRSFRRCVEENLLSHFVDCWEEMLEEEGRKLDAWDWKERVVEDLLGRADFLRGKVQGSSHDRQRCWGIVRYESRVFDERVLASLPEIRKWINGTGHAELPDSLSFL